MTDDDKVVKFPGPSAKETNTVAERERGHLDAARVVAKLAVLDVLGYERERGKSAKALECRVSFLDRIVGHVRAEIDLFKSAYDLKDFSLPESERMTRMHIKGERIMSVGLVSAVYRESKEPVGLVLLADGKFTVSRAVAWKGEE